MARALCSFSSFYIRKLPKCPWARYSLSASETTRWSQLRIQLEASWIGVKSNEWNFYRLRFRFILVVSFWQQKTQFGRWGGTRVQPRGGRARGSHHGRERSDVRALNPGKLTPRNTFTFSSLFNFRKPPLRNKLEEFQLTIARGAHDLFQSKM